MIDLNQQKPLITKHHLLKELTDIEIYRRYIDSVSDIKIGTAMLSPFRKEKSPSFGFFMGESGEICFKDHLLGAGDCIKFVQMKFNLTYFEALSKIAIDFDLASDYICKSFEKTKFVVNDVKFTSREEVLNSVTALKLGKNSRAWALHDIAFWEQFGITIKTLEHFNVQPISYFHVNDKIYPADKHAYCFIEYKDGRETYKFYQPFNEKYKWINGHDSSVWQGWQQLPNTATDLIITKSLKDVMALYEVAKIPAISLQSENTAPKSHIYQQLKNRFQDITLLYDNDWDKEQNWGQLFGEKLAQDLGIVNCVIPDKYQVKDFSDCIKKYGREKAQEILLRETLIPF